MYFLVLFLFIVRFYVIVERVGFFLRILLFFLEFLFLEYVTGSKGRRRIRVVVRDGSWS